MTEVIYVKATDKNFEEMIEASLKDLDDLSSGEVTLMHRRMRKRGRCLSCPKGIYKN